MKKVYIFFIVIFILVIAVAFIYSPSTENYIIMDKTNSAEYEKLQNIHRYIDIYNASREELINFKITFHSREELLSAMEKYNNSIEKKPITDKNELFKKTRDFYDFLYDYTKFGLFESKLAEPFILTYNENADIWIVQENTYNKACTIRGVPGGEFVVFIDAKDGSIVFLTKFM